MVTCYGSTASIRGSVPTSVYTLSKHAGLRGGTMLPKDVTAARKAMEDQILPFAFRSGDSVEYALREATLLAMADRDYGSASRYVEHGSRLCINRGLLHTLRRFNELRLRLLVEGA